MDNPKANSDITKTLRAIFLVFVCGLVCSSVFIKGDKTNMNRAQLVRELIADEGYVNEIYKDHLGHDTFGVGHLVLPDDVECGLPVGSQVSEERIYECLNRDIDLICDDLDRAIPWWRDLDDNRQRVMANMGFNLGLTRLLGFKRFLAAMEAGNYDAAAIEMMDSRWATQVGPRADRLRDRVLGMEHGV
tara:strand:- start:6456 stop:7022 length:567 start_codon:yes stop_codon:yes gene_type:complete